MASRFLPRLASLSHSLAGHSARHTSCVAAWRSGVANSRVSVSAMHSVLSIQRRLVSNNQDEEKDVQYVDMGHEEGFRPMIEPLTLADIEEKTLNIVREFEKVEPGKVKVDCHFIKDLGLDSLDAIELVMAFEDEFDIDIPDEDAEQMLTPQKAINFIINAKKN